MIRGVDDSREVAMVVSAWKVDFQPWHLLPRETRSRPESYNNAITKKKIE